MTSTNTPEDPRRQAVSRALASQFGRAITITDAMIDSVLEGFDEDEQ